MICMKLSARASTSFRYVCSLERNAGKGLFLQKITNNLRSYIKYSTQFCYQICRHLENFFDRIGCTPPPPASRCFFFFFVCDEWASGSSFSKAEYHYPPDKSLSIGQVLEKTNCAFQWIDIYPVDSVIHLLSNWGQMKHSLSYLVLLQQIFLLYTNFLPTLRG